MSATSFLAFRPKTVAGWLRGAGNVSATFIQSFASSSEGGNVPLARLGYHVNETLNNTAHYFIFTPNFDEVWKFSATAAVTTGLSGGLLLQVGNPSQKTSIRDVIKAYSTTTLYLSNSSKGGSKRKYGALDTAAAAFKPVCKGAVIAYDALKGSSRPWYESAGRANYICEGLTKPITAAEKTKQDEGKAKDGVLDFLSHAPLEDYVQWGFQAAGALFVKGYTADTIGGLWGKQVGPWFAQNLASLGGSVMLLLSSGARAVANDARAAALQSADAAQSVAVKNVGAATAAITAAGAAAGTVAFANRIKNAAAANSAAMSATAARAAVAATSLAVFTYNAGLWSNTKLLFKHAGYMPGQIFGTTLPATAVFYVSKVLAVTVYATVFVPLEFIRNAVETVFMMAILRPLQELLDDTVIWGWKKMGHPIFDLAARWVMAESAFSHYYGTITCFSGQSVRGLMHDLDLCSKVGEVAHPQLCNRLLGHVRSQDYALSFVDSFHGTQSKPSVSLSTLLSNAQACAWRWQSDCAATMFLVHYASIDHPITLERPQEIYDRVNGPTEDVSVFSGDGQNYTQSRLMKPSQPSKLPSIQAQATKFHDAVASLMPEAAARGNNLTILNLAFMYQDCIKGPGLKNATACSVLEAVAGNASDAADYNGVVTALHQDLGQLTSEQLHFAIQGSHCIPVDGQNASTECLRMAGELHQMNLTVAGDAR